MQRMGLLLRALSYFVCGVFHLRLTTPAGFDHRPKSPAVMHTQICSKWFWRSGTFMGTSCGPSMGLSWCICEFEYPHMLCLWLQDLIGPPGRDWRWLVQTKSTFQFCPGSLLRSCELLLEGFFMPPGKLLWHCVCLPHRSNYLQNLISSGGPGMDHLWKLKAHCPLLHS